MSTYADSTTHPLLRLWRYAVQYRKRIYLAILSSTLNKLFDLAPPVLIGAAVDIVVRREDSVIADWGVRDPGRPVNSLGSAHVCDLGLRVDL